MMTDSELVYEKSPRRVILLCIVVHHPRTNPHLFFELLEHHYNHPPSQQANYEHDGKKGVFLRRKDVACV